MKIERVETNNGLLLINYATGCCDGNRYFSCSAYCNDSKRYVSDVKIDIRELLEVLKSNNISNVGYNRSFKVEDRANNVIMNYVASHFSLYFHLDSEKFIVISVREASLITILSEINAITDAERESVRKSRR